jgi:hypothetical protein
MKLGETQLKWINELENHPERQVKGYLGKIGKNNEDKVVCELCCLGQAVVVLENIDINNFEGSVRSGNNSTELCFNHQELLGLMDDNGKVIQKVLPYGHIFKSEKYDSLSEINDYGYEFDGKPTWVLIAETMKKYPEWAFKKSK